MMQLAKWVIEQCLHQHRVLLSTEGPFRNVIKVKPPICFSTQEVDRMVGALEQVLGEGMQV